MSNEIEFSEESLRRIAAQKVTFRFSVEIHVIVYLVVNIILAIINAIFVRVPQIISNWWIIYPALSWLIGLMIHATAYMLYAHGIRYATRGIIFSSVAYIFGMLLLIMVDNMTSPPLDWVFYPAIFWGIGLGIQILLTYLITRKTTSIDEKKVSGKEKAIEKEMQKMREKLKK